jgi:hypothetical protein
MSKGQRDRLYEAEDQVIGPADWFASVEGAQFLVDETLRKKKWRDQSPVREIEVEYPAKETGATFVSAERWKVSFRPLSLNSINLAHEMSHVYLGVTPSLTAEGHQQDHSAHFAQAELEIVRLMISGSVAARLRDAFKANGVEVADVR